jgi:hypothetical protein
MGVDDAKKAALVRYKLIGDIDFATLYEFNEQIEQSLTKL